MVHAQDISTLLLLLIISCMSLEADISTHKRKIMKIMIESQKNSQKKRKTNNVEIFSNSILMSSLGTNSNLISKVSTISEHATTHFTRMLLSTRRGRLKVMVFLKNCMYITETKREHKSSN